ncbi:hypothetical protein GW916_05630 [bacterium]|nr:hypothetical protein [bacterium]
MTKNFSLALLIPFVFQLSACAKDTSSFEASSATMALSPPPAVEPDSPNQPETPPSQDSENSRVWKLAVVSDMNKSYGSTAYTPELRSAVSHIQELGVQAVLSTGDMVAGQKKGLNYQAMWNSFHSVVTQKFVDSSIPFLPSPGNHDASHGSAFKTEREIYRKNFLNFPIDQFNAKRPQEDRIEFLKNVEQNYPLNYAVTMGPALLIGVDATAVGPLINDQLGWLEEVLAEGHAYKIKIIYGHMPLYPFAFTKASESMAQGSGSSGFADRLEALLEKYKVTYFLSGHHHVFYPGHRNGSVHYISVPLLGSGKRKLLTKNRTHNSRSDEAFLYLTFNDKGEHSLKAIKSPSREEVSWNSLPPAVSLPSSSSSDCKGCGSFPKSLFLNSIERILYNRISR